MFKLQVLGTYNTFTYHFISNFKKIIVLKKILKKIQTKFKGIVAAYVMLCSLCFINQDQTKQLKIDSRCNKRK